MRPSVSRRLTGRAEHDRCAKSLADTVAAVLVSPTKGNLEALHEALQRFTRARKSLDG